MIDLDADHPDFVEVDPTGRYGRVWLMSIHNLCFLRYIVGFFFLKQFFVPSNFLYNICFGFLC